MGIKNIDGQDYFVYDSCGCKFKVIGYAEDGRPLIDFDPDVEKIPLDCSDTWKLIQSGLLKGCFQLESPLGRHWAKTLKPENIEQLAGLVSVLRPGQLNSNLEDGKSITEHYCMRKNGEEVVEPYHPALGDILKDTYQLLIYQEEQLQIAQKIAGFSLKDADLLRRAVGKKKADLMLEMKVKFLEGCKKVGLVTEEQAETIFGWIAAAARYSFNKCLYYKTKVRTKSGLKQLNQLIIGEEIDTPYGWSKVLNIYNNGKKELWKIKLFNSFDIICTLDHELLTFSNGKQKVINVIQNNDSIKCFDGKYHQILSLERFGFNPTLDIEIEHPYHIFYANDIAVGNSHAVGYALGGTYLSAYAKAHFPKAFFISCLYHSKGKPDPKKEVSELITEAKQFNITVNPPKLYNLNSNFDLINNQIWFGLTNIKNVGDSSISELNKAKDIAQSINKPIKEWAWLDHLLLHSPHVKSNAYESLILVGALNVSESRTQQLFEYTTLSELTKKELEWLQNYYKENGASSLKELFEVMVNQESGRGKATSNKNRREKIKGLITSLESPPFSLKDSGAWIVGAEEALLGISLTATRLDDLDTSAATITCREFINKVAPIGGIYLLAGEVTEIKRYITKNGQEMMFGAIKDEQGDILDKVVVFADALKEYGQLLVENNTLLLGGKRGEKERSDSFIVERCYQI